MSLKCYNKGCGIDYESTNDKEDSCSFHPGEPIFHDAYKKWSCCGKKSTDFTEFLNYPGCTKGRHNSVKPKLPEPKKNEETNGIDISTVVIKPIPKPLERPSTDETKCSLKTTIASSLQQLLDKKTQLTSSEEVESIEEKINGIKIGESCKNSSCKTSYEGSQSDFTTCRYHPGSPVFHEGLKFWSCCERKTTDFDNFMDQDGCTTGKHIWLKEEDESIKKVNCRVDWHQTPKYVTVSVFAKSIVPGETVIRANKVSLDLTLSFESGNSIYSKSLVLNGIIDPAGSNVKLMGTKCEINLLKGEPGSWSKLEIPPQKPAEENDSDDGIDELE